MARKTTTKGGKAVLPKLSDKDTMPKPIAVRMPSAIPRLDAAPLSRDLLMTLCPSPEPQQEASSFKQDDPEPSSSCCPSIHGFSSDFLKAVSVLGMSEKIDAHFRLFGQANALVRPTIRDALSHLTTHKHVLLTGDKGCGKSMTLLQLASILHREQSAVLLYVSEGKPDFPSPLTATLMTLL